jgi:hypothetical protein
MTHPSSLQFAASYVRSLLIDNLWAKLSENNSFWMTERKTDDSLTYEDWVAVKAVLARIYQNLDVTLNSDNTITILDKSLPYSHRGWIIKHRFLFELHHSYLDHNCDIGEKLVHQSKNLFGVLPELVSLIFTDRLSNTLGEQHDQEAVPFPYCC